MAHILKVLRSSVTGRRPTGKEPGELYVNWADKQLGVIESTNQELDLLPIRFFSSTADYVIGDFVVHNGQLYRANEAITAGPFFSVQWTEVGAGGGNITISDVAPLNPNEGDLWWDNVGGQLYIYYDDGNSAQWVVANNTGGAGGGRVTISHVVPANPNEGDLWWDSVSAQLFIYYNDGSSSQWVVANNTGSTSGSGIVISDTPPVNPNHGDLWWDSVGGQLFIYYIDVNSEQWVAANSNAGLDDAPSNGVLYGRRDAGWATIRQDFVPSAGGTITGGTVFTNTAPVQFNSMIMPAGGAMFTGNTTTFEAPPKITTPIPDDSDDNTTITSAWARANIKGSGGVGNDNIIINGDMYVDQRYNGGQLLNPPNAKSYTVDRWCYNTNAGTQNGTIQRRLTTGNPLLIDEFPYCLEYTKTAPAFTPTGTQFISFTQYIEADMISNLAWGTLRAKPITLSFWAQNTNSTTRIGGGSIQNAATNRSYPFIFDFTTDFSWQKYEITIPGDIIGTWNKTGNGIGLVVNFCISTGPTGTNTAGAWVAGNFIGPNNVGITLNATYSIRITGVKLEIGDVATPFSRGTIAKRLSDCQRYYQVFPANQLGFGAYSNAAGAQFFSGISFLTTLRASPTILLTTPTYTNSTGLATISYSTNGIYFRLTGSAVGNSSVAFGFTADCEL